MRYKVWRSNKDKELHLLCARARTLLRRCQPQFGISGHGSEARKARRTGCVCPIAQCSQSKASRLSTYTSASSILKPLPPRQCCAGKPSAQTARARRGGSARWVKKEDVLAMRWAWVDQGTLRPIGGPRRAFGADACQGSPRARTTRGPHPIGDT